MIKEIGLTPILFTISFSHSARARFANFGFSTFDEKFMRLNIIENNLRESMGNIKLHHGNLEGF
jgi:hypothetical protein